jgi:hypothetical protein
MNKIYNRLTLLTIGSGLFVNLLYMQHQNIKLERHLLDSHKNCAEHKQELVDRYEENLDNVQQEIDQNLQMQATTNQSINDNLFDAQKETNSIAKPEIEDFNESLEDIIARKYHFLLRYFNVDPVVLEELKALLREREEIALMIKDGQEFAEETGLTREQIWDLESQLSEIDYEIEQLLGQEYTQRYTMLKDSDDEQKQINQYTLGVNGIFPLDDNQQEAVLLSRLKHKQSFEKKLNALGIDMDYPLTMEQRDTLKADIEMAAMRYKHGFLMEIRNNLSHDNFPMDQYTLLENHTNTEFQEIIRELYTKIDERGVVN